MPASPRLLLALGLAACRPEPPPAEPEPEPVPARELVIGVHADVTSLDQHHAKNALDAAVSDPLSLYLFDVGFEGGRQVFGPALAERWELSGDRRELALDLRSDASWHDGQPLRAQDVVFTFALAADRAAASHFAPVAALLAPERGVEALASDRLVFRFAEPQRLEDALARLSTVVILPEHLLAAVPREDLRSHPFERAPVLSGCWRFEAWEPGRHISFVARPWGEGEDACHPALDRVVFRILPDYHARLVELGAGRLDLVADLRVQDLAPLRAEHPEIRFVRRGPRSLVYVAWNERAPRDEAPSPLFADAGVRRALAQAVDVDRLIQDLFADPEEKEPFARRAVGSITPALGALVPQDLAPLPCDPAAARAALAHAGWRDGDGDGVLERDGRPFRFELLQNASSPVRAQVGVALQADLAAVGVAVELISLERTAYLERVERRDFDALLGSLSAGLFVDPAPTWHSGPAGSRNYVGYSDPEVDALIERGAAAPTTGEAEAAWRALQPLIYADQPWLFLYWADEIVALRDRVEGAQIDIQAPWHDLEAWKIGP